MSSAHSVCSECEMKKSRQFWPVQFHSTPAPNTLLEKSTYSMYQCWLVLSIWLSLASDADVPTPEHLQHKIVHGLHCSGTKRPCIAVFKWNRGGSNWVKSELQQSNLGCARSSPPAPASIHRENRRTHNIHNIPKYPSQIYISQLQRKGAEKSLVIYLLVTFCDFIELKNCKKDLQPQLKKHDIKAFLTKQECFLADQCRLGNFPRMKATQEKCRVVWPL